MDKNYLLEYMPDYYEGVYEMEELLKAQGVSLAGLDEDRKQILLNQFITQADSKGLSVFEDQLGIIPDPSDDLETRRNNVLVKMLPPHPITLGYLRYLFKLFKLPAYIKVSYPNRELSVTSFDGELTETQQRLIAFTLNSYLPANMQYVYRTWQKLGYAHAYIGTAVTVKVTATAKAEILTPEQQKAKFYEWGLWQKTTGKGYVGSTTTSKTVVSVQAERRKL